MSSVKTPSTRALQTHVAGLNFTTPILNASGAFNPVVFNQLFSLEETLGGIVTKTVTQAPRIGNAQQRTVELAGIGMLNSIGLQNPGLDISLKTDIDTFAKLNTPIVMSISAYSNTDFAAMAETIEAHPNGKHIHALEINLSCPNVAKGVEFGSDPTLVKEAISAIKQVTKKPLFAKLTPNVGNMVPIAEGAVEGGADGLTAINTLLGLAIDIEKKAPVMARGSGGYSGPGVKPVAMHHVWQLHHYFPEIPIMAVGGIGSADDVIEFMMAGASLVQVGTSCFRHPMVFKEITDTLAAYCLDNGIDRISQLTGVAHTKTS